MQKILIFIASLAFIGLSAEFASAAQASPLLVPADLDQAVAMLPIRVAVDPVDALEERLAQLQKEQVINSERPALSQALDIIRLSRSIRLTTSQRPVVAGL